MPNIFYQTRELSNLEKLDILRAAKEISTTWWVDILDCEESWARQRIKMSFEDICFKLSEPHGFTIIERNCHQTYGELGFSTFGNPSYFLWIETTIENLKKICAAHEISPT